MSSQLHRGVELAQAGQRDEARAILRQVVQADPHNEIGWLWLASVAADQAEYEQALQEVLRVNPNNTQAQRSLAEFRAQQQSSPYAQPSPAPGAAPPVSPLPYSSGPAPASPPPQPPPQAPSPYAVPPAQQVQQPPQYGQQVYGVPPQQQAGYAAFGAEPEKPKRKGGFSGVFGKPAPQDQQVKVYVKDRRGCFGCARPSCIGCGGCGCFQGCILALAVIIILPALLCGAMSVTNVPLGPLDFVATLFPGPFGRRSVDLEVDGYNVTLDVPRSWYLAEAGDDWWDGFSEALDEAIPFEDADLSWQDLEFQPGETPIFLEISPIVLAMSGDMAWLAYDGLASGVYNCPAVREAAGTTMDVIEYDDGLCGTRIDATVPFSGDPVFQDFDPPDESHTIGFVVPVNETAAMQWQIYLPETAFERLEKKIDYLIENISIEPAS